ncbi:MAG TPA: DUF72 domain-containing protein [Actinomycetota bacterium]|nr:DUF72 domain-containing protein [Actinomycetota bacterium]
MGMSGFSYPEWIGEVYPPGTKRKDLLAAYARIFDAVEINMTFRRNPEEKTIDGWRAAVPDDFRFAVKANARITHFRRLVDVGEVVAEFMERIGRMGVRLGCVLFQLRANMQFDAAVLDAFGASLPAGRYALEPRNATFMTDKAFDVLRTHGIALCLNDDLFDPKTYVRTGAFAYLRFHRAAYSAAEIDERAALINEFADPGDVFAFFAHEDDPECVAPALAMKRILT